MSLPTTLRRSEIHQLARSTLAVVPIAGAEGATKASKAFAALPSLQRVDTAYTNIGNVDMYFGRASCAIVTFVMARSAQQSRSQPKDHFTIDGTDATWSKACTV